MEESSSARRTVCPCACYDACGMVAHVEGGRIVRVEGDPGHRATRGALCPRADRYVERTYHPERLLRPMARAGESGSDAFEPVAWDEAIDRIAAALSQLAREYDPRALLYVTGSGQNGVMTQFGNLFLSYYGGYSSLYGDLCMHAGMEAVRLTFGALRFHPPEDARNSRMIVLWGKNAAVTSPHQMRFLREAREKGAKLVCVDPLATKTARECDLHLAPRPGTDGFLANALAHVIVAEGLHDRDFVDAHVHGFEEYRWMVRNYEPAKAAATCGLAESEIVEFARAYAATRPANLSVGFGVQRYRNAGQTVRAIAALPAITGNIGVSGGGLDFFNQDAFVTRPYPFKLPAPPRIRQLGPVGRLGRSVLNAKDPPIKAAIVERANPMTQTPFTPAVHYALTRLDFVCVIDQFLTDTARRAHIVLPAKSMFEETDVHPGPWHGMLQLKQKLVDPPGEVRTERAIYRALAEALGYPTEQFDLPEEEFINRVLPAGLSVSRLRRQPFARRGAGDVPFSDRRFSTPSGKIELRSEAAEVSWHVDPLPFYTPPRESEASDPERFRRFPLRLLTPKSEHRQLSQWGNDETLRARDEPGVRVHPEDAAARGIAEGERVRVFNDRGEVRLPARLDGGVRRGVVAMASGTWISRDGHSVNVLTHDDVTDMGYAATFFDCLVQVERSPR
ncbi:MAG: molybdopterin-containing oxidoreductase family protein [Planctomycetota bacterium]